MSGELTVKECCTRFSSLTDTEIQKLTGKKDYGPEDKISTDSVFYYALNGGNCSSELASYYESLFSNDQVNMLAKTAGVNLSNAEPLNKQDQSNNAKIDKDVSIFDIAREQKEKENKTEYA